MKKKAQWEPESMDSDGNILMRFKGIPIPDILYTATVENCGECGSITIVGIYEMKEPEISFPGQDELQ